MIHRKKAKRGWFARWREHRLARRQRALERWYLELDRARASGESPVPGELYVYAAGSSNHSDRLFGAFVALGHGGEGKRIGGGGDGGCGGDGG